MAAMLVGAICAQQACSQTATGQPASNDAASAAGALTQFVRTFNTHNAAALGNLWAANGLHVSEDDGVRLEGRAAIAKGYGALFAGDPNCELSVQTGGTRQIAPSVISVDGVATVSHTQGYETRSRFTAILTKEGDGWQVNEVRERRQLAAGTTPLAQLDWLVGQWTGKSDDAEIQVEMHWADNRNFLMGRVTHERAGETTGEVLHIIGWDVEQQCVRSWQFAHDGGYAEGIWQPDGDKQWLNKLVVKYADGRRGSLIHVVTRTADDELALRTIDREVDGAWEPNSATVTLTRRGRNAATTASSGPAKSGPTGASADGTGPTSPPAASISSEAE
jgi:uncharacterized protein (TIGR02246 family)